jgi:hypothetical protein
LLVTVILGGLIVLGSRNLNHFDAALVGYTFATLFAAFGITYRYAMWLRRPPTRMYWRRGWSVFLTPRFVGSNLVEALRRFINAFVANRFIFRRGRLRGAAHWLMMWDRAGAAQQQRAEQAQDADFKKDDACRRRTPGRRHLSRKNHRQQTRSNPKDHHRCPSEGRQVRVRKHRWRARSRKGSAASCRTRSANRLSRRPRCSRTLEGRHRRAQRQWRDQEHRAEDRERDPSERDEMHVADHPRVIEETGDRLHQKPATAHATPSARCAVAR